MTKVILITGATDGIGLLTAQKLAKMGHELIIHGRSAEKLETTKTLIEEAGATRVTAYRADFSNLTEVKILGNEILTVFNRLDIIINNAGVYKTPVQMTPDNRDVRFVVNTFAPVLLTNMLMPRLGTAGRVVSLSSAAQESVNLDALGGDVQLSEAFSAYAQSKLAITMWSRLQGLKYKESGPVFIAVNPGSLLASKMVKEGFGVAGKDLDIGADILIRCSLNNEFNTAGGLYFDNDIGDFSSPHPDALDNNLCQLVVEKVLSVL